MIREIRKLQDPILRFKAKKVHRQSKESVDALKKDLLETVKFTNALGLAATQIGEGLRVIVFDSSPGNQQYQVMINPEITQKSDQQETGTEGCLSLPGILVNVMRSTIVHVRWDSGKKHRTFTGLIARVLQHEIDHLDGVLIIDKAEMSDKEIHTPSMI